MGIKRQGTDPVTLVKEMYSFFYNRLKPSIKIRRFLITPAAEIFNVNWMNGTRGAVEATMLGNLQGPQTHTQQAGN